MKKFIFATLLGLLIALFQTSFLNELFGVYLNPNWLLSIVFAFLMVNRFNDALYLSIVFGFILDLFGVGPVGLSSFIFVCFVIVAKLFTTLVLKGITGLVILIPIVTIFYRVLIFSAPLTLQTVMYGFINLAFVFFFAFFIRRLEGRYLSVVYRIRA
ncbi:hypothetical protein KAZ57_01605 [Patescibacteria group bacterium]|nr:hypothetical protein [Patescibacteria group bacterium]